MSNVPETISPLESSFFSQEVKVKRAITYISGEKDKSLDATVDKLKTLIDFNELNPSVLALSHYIMNNIRELRRPSWDPCSSTETNKDVLKRVFEYIDSKAIFLPGLGIGHRVSYKKGETSTVYTAVEGGREKYITRYRIEVFRYIRYLHKNFYADVE